MKLAETWGMLTLVEHCRDSHHLLQELGSVDRGMNIVDAEVVFTPEDERRGILEVGSS